MGAVYSAHDRERDEVVALKTLLRADATAIYRLKKEFRALADLAHVNLVTLYELISDDGWWFFTMELVDGIPFIDYVRPGAVRVDRLRAALTQLVDGVRAIHQAGLLHRDLKPSNVLVTPEGRVVILDFGISVDLASRAGAVPTVEEGVFGTVAYMAPEQVASQATTASDWYAVGGMLYEALTGALPFTGEPLQVLAEKVTSEPRFPEDADCSVPADLKQLCLELLRGDPSVRPSGRQVLEALGVTAPGVPQSQSDWPAGEAPLVGREEHLAELARAVEASRQGGAIAVLLHGPSGIGKSALVQQFVGSLASQSDAVVLAGRCYERETMPFKAWDEVLDSLSRYLRALPPAQATSLVFPELHVLTRVFPVLERVEAIERVPYPEQESNDPVEVRRRAFEALRQLLARIAERRPLVVWIDDLQWGNADDVAQLQELVRPPGSPPIVLVLSFRSEEIESHAFLRSLLADARTRWCRDMSVRPLSQAQTWRLARQTLGSEIPASGHQLRAIVEESGGSPFLVEQLVRHVQALAGRDDQSGAVKASLRDMLTLRVARLPEGAGSLLEILAVAARPIDAAVARAAAGLTGDERPLLARLRTEHLLRSSVSAEQVELYHDRIRETLVQQVGPDRMRNIHERLLIALEAQGVDDPESLFEHSVGAGLKERASTYAVRAAQRAAKTLAFDRSAGFYRQALGLAPEEADRTPLWVGLAEALANAGRGREAADAYLTAAARGDESQALEWRRCAAEQLLRSGHVDRGLSVVGSVLRAVGLHLARTPRRALGRLLARRLWIRIRGLGFDERPVAEVDPSVLRRIDTVWGVAVGLARIDTIRGADFQTLNLLLSLRAGEAYRIARALAAEAAFVSLNGTPARNRVLYLLRLTDALAERTQHPHALGLARLARGIASFYVGQFSQCRTDCEAANRLFGEQCTGVAWEINTAHYYMFSSLWYQGELATLAERAPARLRAAQEHGDLYAAADVAAGRPIVAWLMADDISVARALCREAVEGWSHEAFHLQHYLSMFAAGQIDLYAGDVDEAWDRIRRKWPALRRSLLLRVVLIRNEALHLRARSALAAAVGGHGNRERRLRSAERDGLRLMRGAGRGGWAEACGHLILAGVRAARDDQVAAEVELSLALDGFIATGLAAYAAAARRRLWQLHGEQGTGAAPSATAEADAWFRAQGVANPERLTAMLAPGFPI